MEKFNISLSTFLSEIDETLIPSGSTTYAYLYVPSGNSYSQLIYKKPNGVKIDLLKNITTTNVSDVKLTGNTLNISYSDGTSSGITLSTLNTYITGGTYSNDTLTLTLNDASTIDINNLETNPAGINGSVQINTASDFDSVNGFTMISGVLSVPTGITTNYITLGSTSVSTNGTIRYNGTNFQGKKASGWINLDEGSTDTYVTGGTLNGANLVLALNNGGNTQDIDLSSLTGGVGTGNTNYITKWGSSTGLTNSIIQDDGTVVSINSTTFSESSSTISSGVLNLNSTSGLTTISAFTGVNIINGNSGNLNLLNGSTTSGSRIGLFSTGATNSTILLQASSTNQTAITIRGNGGLSSYSYNGPLVTTVTDTNTFSASTHTISATNALNLSGYTHGLTIEQSGTTISGRIYNVGKRITHKIGGADFYSGGGDDGGAFTGDYSLYVGEESASGIIIPSGTTYPVNTAFGYGALKGAQNVEYITVIGGGAGRDLIREETPDSGVADASGVIIGNNTFRGISSYNVSIGIGSFVGQGIKSILRGTIIGNYAFNNYNKSLTDDASKLYKVTAMGSYVGALPTGNDSVYAHTIAIGHETLLFSSGSTDSVLIGDYIGIYEKPENAIVIGQYRSSGESFTRMTGVTSNIISIGNKIVPVQENTINFPLNYNMGLGTLEPTQKLDINGNLRIRNNIFDSTNSTGTTNQVLTTTPSGVVWATVSGGGGSGDNFYVTGGTFTNTNEGTLTLTKNDNNTVSVSGFNQYNIYVTGGTATSSTLTLRRANGSNIGIDVSNVGSASFGNIAINQGTVFDSNSDNTILTAQITRDTIEFVDSTTIGVTGLFNGLTDFGLQFDVNDNSLSPTKLNYTGTLSSDKKVVINSAGQFRYEHSSVVHNEITVGNNTVNVDVTNVSAINLDTVIGGTSPFNISGFTGGVKGQVLYVINLGSVAATIEHNNALANQPIYLRNINGLSIEGNLGYTFYCTGTAWYQVG